jgi:hypothetical protein
MEATQVPQMVDKQERYKVMDISANKGYIFQ